ncbi:restriction endonuclease subunit S [bacterium]|nr:restriction endonuclease subunit S [bacterium]
MRPNRAVGWEETTFSSLGTIQSGYAFKSGDYCEAGIPLVRISNLSSSGEVSLEDGTAFLPPHFAEQYRDFKVNKGDLLIALSGATTGKVATYNLDDLALLNQRVGRLRPKDERYRPFASMLLRNLSEKVLQSARGGAQPNISPSDIAKFPILMPSVKEQHRIVARIEELTARSKTAKQALQAIPPLLEKFRQSVLAAAFRGDLTANWRQHHPHIEPASEILRRIRTQQSAEPRKRKKSEVENRSSWASQPPLPNGWCWATLEECAEKAANSICAGPFGTIFKAHDFRPEGVPIIFLRHVMPFNYRPEHKPGFMDTGRWKELFQPYSVFGGELLVTKLGDPPGACAEYPIGLGPAMVTPDVIKISVHPELSASYLLGYLNSAGARKYATEESYGATRARINLALFRDQPVPVAPLAEQLVICQLVQQAVEFIREKQALIEKLDEDCKNLDQSILSKAFRGELVANGG